MTVITADRIAEMIEQAPAWTLAGLTMAKEPLRDAERHELAEHLYDALYRLPDRNLDQLALPLA